MEGSRRINFFTTFIFFAVLFFVGFGKSAAAASLSLTPSSGSYAVGTTIAVQASVSSLDQTINAVSSVISFPADKLEVVSASKSDSIFSLWIQEPTFSNSRGTVSLEGIVLNPGFSGNGGHLATIVFKTKASGDAAVIFSSAAVLANDGKGTNVLSGFQNALFSIGAKSAVTNHQRVTGKAPEAPQITSPTHPAQDKWYALNDAKFIWPLPKGVTVIRTMVDATPDTVPTLNYRVADFKDYPDTPEGIWYFHARFKNVWGWGATAHYRFQIDTEKPNKFNLLEAECQNDLASAAIKFLFDAEDKTSGIDHFEIKIDDGAVEIWQDDGAHVYTTPVLGSGEHLLVARAVDKAGNFLEKSVKFEIKKIPPPIITDHPCSLSSGSILEVHGRVWRPSTKVVVWLQGDGQTQQTQILSDDRSDFLFKTDRGLEEGNYKLWAESVDDYGNKSDPSEELDLTVKQSNVFVIDFWILWLCLTVILLFLVLFGLGWFEFCSLRRKMKDKLINKFE